MRIFLNVVGFTSIFFAPFWVPILAATFLSARWRAWEILIMGMFVDALWLPHSFYWGFPVATIGAILLVWAFEPMRREFLLQ